MRFLSFFFAPNDLFPLLFFFYFQLVLSLLLQLFYTKTHQKSQRCSTRPQRFPLPLLSPESWLRMTLEVRFPFHPMETNPSLCS